MTTMSDLPEGTKLVLFTDFLMQELAGEGIVEWGEPTPEGWYVPAITEDARLENSRREVRVLEAELASLADSVLRMKPRYEAMEKVWDWIAQSHAAFPEHDHHCPQGNGDTSRSCSCGYAAAEEAMEELDRMDAEAEAEARQ
jgi:hypothetical protein